MTTAQHVKHVASQIYVGYGMIFPVIFTYVSIYKVMFEYLRLLVVSIYEIYIINIQYSYEKYRESKTILDDRNSMHEFY